MLSTHLPAKLIRRVAIILAGGLFLTGCTTVQVDSGGGKKVTGFGFVQVELPPATDGVLAVNRSGFGLGWDDSPGGGVWLGYSASEWVIADPSDCQLLVIIRSL